MIDHEYALLGGINRAQIGRYLGSIAALISSGIVFLLLSFVNLADKFGIPVNLPPSILSLIGAGSVFTILYWLFSRYVWRWARVRDLLKVPDLAGTWECNGVSIALDEGEEQQWDGTIVITQSWDRIRVRMKTRQSSSNSIVASLLYDEADGYQLIYNYRNDPKISETQLSSHLGFSSMTISRNLRKAEGEYFNGRGRITFGTMNWEKR